MRNEIWIDGYKLVYEWEDVLRHLRTKPVLPIQFSNQKFTARWHQIYCQTLLILSLACNVVEINVKSRRVRGCKNDLRPWIKCLWCPLNRIKWRVHAPKSRSYRHRGHSRVHIYRRWTQVLWRSLSQDLACPHPRPRPRSSSSDWRTNDFIAVISGQHSRPTWCMEHAYTVEADQNAYLCVNAAAETIYIHIDTYKVLIFGCTRARGISSACISRNSKIAACIEDTTCIVVYHRIWKIMSNQASPMQ